MSRYRICNWAKYQHYKDRNPPWIKLHVEILQSEDWVMLDDASRLLAVVCMVVAAKDNGEFNGSPDYLKRVAYLNKRPNLTPLIDCGFLEEVLADASACKPMHTNVRPEKEAYRTDTDTEKKERETRAPEVLPEAWGREALQDNPGIDVADQFKRFLLHHDGKTCANWRPKWLMWCARAKDYGQLAEVTTGARLTEADAERIKANVKALGKARLTSADFTKHTGIPAAKATREQVEAFILDHLTDIPEPLRRVSA